MILCLCECRSILHIAFFFLLNISKYNFETRGSKAHLLICFSFFSALHKVGPTHVLVCILLQHVNWFFKIETHVLSMTYKIKHVYLLSKILLFKLYSRDLSNSVAKKIIPF